MDNTVEASAERVRDHLRRPLAGSRDLLMETAGNTVTETVPDESSAMSA
jgi:NAD(P)H-hydrate repair Nnr-like enzyme with NAD(P)H-hydrate epimerase domain